MSTGDTAESIKDSAAKLITWGPGLMGAIDLENWNMAARYADAMLVHVYAIQTYARTREKEQSR